MAGERRPVREHNAEQEEYRRRQEQKAKRRRKQQMNRLLLLGACVLGVVLLVVVVVNIFKAILNPDKSAVKSSSVTSSSMTEAEADSVLNAGRPMAKDPEAWNLIVINNQSAMPDGFAPTTKAIDNIGHTVDERIAESLTAMIEACNSEAGNALAVVSAERGPQTQNGNYQRLVDQFKAAGKSEADADMLARRIDPPYGYSDHQTALAVDFVTATVGTASDEFAATPEAAWLTAHAAEYGFVLRFPENKQEITGIDYQPYHFRYVGKDEAAEMKSAGICLEEYVAVQPVAAANSNTGEGGEAGADASGSDAANGAAGDSASDSGGDAAA